MQAQGSWVFMLFMSKYGIIINTYASDCTIFHQSAGILLHLLLGNTGFIVVAFKWCRLKSRKGSVLWSDKHKKVDFQLTIFKRIPHRPSQDIARTKRTAFFFISLSLVAMVTKWATVEILTQTGVEDNLTHSRWHCKTTETAEATAYCLKKLFYFFIMCLLRVTLKIHFLPMLLFFRF